VQLQQLSRGHVICANRTEHINSGFQHRFLVFACRSTTASSISSTALGPHLRSHPRGVLWLSSNRLRFDWLDGSIFFIMAVMAEKRWIRLMGRALDASELIKSHPGGERMLKLALWPSCDDATRLVESYHPYRSSALLSWIEQLTQAGPGDSTQPKPSANREQGLWGSKFYQELMNDPGIKTAQSQRGVSGGRKWLLMWLLLHFVLFYPGLWYLHRSASILGPLLIIAQFPAWGFGVFHFAHHGAFDKRVPYLAAYVEHFSNIFMFLGDHWRSEHNAKHHVHTNHPTNDPDVSSGVPFLRTEPRQAWHPWHRYQHWYVLPMLCLYGFVGPNKAKFDIRKPWLAIYPMVSTFSLLISPLLFGHGSFSAALLNWLVIWLSLGLIVGSNFLVNHNSNASGSNADWWARQVEESVNWSGFYACFWTGGLNYQIEHHLFPNLNPMIYPKIAPAVRSICKRHSVRYTHHPSFFASLNSTLAHLRLLGQK
jgi:fatty acid desaturase